MRFASCIGVVRTWTDQVSLSSDLRGIDILLVVVNTATENRLRLDEVPLLPQVLYFLASKKHVSLFHFRESIRRIALQKGSGRLAPSDAHQPGVKSGKPLPRSLGVAPRSLRPSIKSSHQSSMLFTICSISPPREMCVYRLRREFNCSKLIQVN